MTTLDEFLAPYTPPVQEMALKTRDLVLSLFPDAVEQIDVSGKLLGYGWDTTYAAQGQSQPGFRAGNNFA